MNVLDFVYNYFERPELATAAAGDRRLVGAGLLGFVFGGLSLFAARALILPLSPLSFGFLAALSVLTAVIYGFLLTATLHLIVELSGRRGSAGGLYALLGMAQLSWAVAVPLALISRAFKAWLPGIYPLIFFVVGLTAFSLKAKSLRLNYDLSRSQSWLFLCLPYAAAIAIIVAVGLLAAALAMIGLASQFQGLRIL